MTKKIAQLSDRLAAGAGSLVTRKRLLNRAGRLAAVGAFGVALADVGGGSTALATGTANSPCGPSPICPSTRCTSGGDCRTDNGCAYRGYATSQCVSASVLRAWAEDYRSVGKGLWNCVDCCCLGLVGGSSCFVNCGTRIKCTCRFRIA